MFLHVVEKVEFDSSFDCTSPGVYEKAYKNPGVQRNAPCRGHLRDAVVAEAQRLTIAFNHSQNTIALVVGMCSGHFLY